jgi:hypothetical protein
VALSENQAANEENKHQPKYREKPVYLIQIDILLGVLSVK